MSNCKILSYILIIRAQLWNTVHINVSTCTAGRDSPIHLGRTPQDQCSGSQLVCGGCQPFRNERIIARDDATFLAQIGPSGNERGYMGITGEGMFRNVTPVSACACTHVCMHTHVFTLQVK